jgi:CysZ protein
MKPGFFDGLFIPLRALKFLGAHIGLMRYFLIPFFINILVFGLGTWTFIHYFGDLLHAFIGTPEIWWQYILYYLSATVLALLFSVVLVFGFTAVGMIIAAPFLDVLSQRTEELFLSKTIDEPFSFGVLTKDAQQAVGNELKKIGLLILVQGALLLCNFIPVIGQVAYAIGAPLCVVFFLVYEYMDFTLSRKRIPFGNKWKLIFDNKAATFGMGVAFFFTTVIPFINLFVMPVAVIGATLLFLHIKHGPEAHSQSIDELEIPDVEEMVDDVLSDS